MATNLPNIIAGLFPAFAYESITVTDSAKSLTSGTYTDEGEAATRAFITAEDAQMRYRYDGTTPTDSEGHLLNPMDSLVLKGSSNIKNFKIIRKSTTNGTIRVTYEK